MKENIIISIQSPVAGGDPITIYNGKKISYEESRSLNVAGLITSHSTYERIDTTNYSLFWKTEGKVKKFIVYCNLNERDEVGRRIQYSSYIETTKALGESLKTMECHLNNNGYSTAGNLLDEIVEQAIKTKNKKFIKTCICIGVAAAALALLYVITKD